MRKPGRCKHCSAAIRPSYERCFPPCAARLAFESKEGDEREERKRAKVLAVIERSREVDRSLAEGRAVLERLEREDFESTQEWRSRLPSRVEVQVDAVPSSPSRESKRGGLNTCKHCGGTILSGYDSCSDCTSRLEFAVEQARQRELALERAKAAAVEELVHERVMHLTPPVRTPERMKELEAELARELQLARTPTEERKRNRKLALLVKREEA